MKQLGRFTEKLVDGFSTIGGVFSQIVAALMMLLITADVVGRYFFKSPTYVAGELSGYFLVAITFLALGQTQKMGRHLRVDIIFTWLSQKQGKVLEFVASILSLAFLVWFTWSTTIGAMQTYDMGTRTQTILRTPYWIPQLLLPIGLGIFSLQMIVNTVKQAMSFGSLKT